MNRGYLVLIGGAEDRRNEKLILKELVNMKLHKTAVIIPTASMYPTGLGQDYYYIFREMGIENVYVFDIREKSEVDRKENIDIIEKTDLIFFTGGDQVRLAEIFLNTALMLKIRERFNEGVTIAGTSAGAAVASDPMLFDGDDVGFVKGTIGSSKGFGFINGITIDTHFDARFRSGRLIQFLCLTKNYKGIGLGEDTAVFINHDNIMKVTGSSHVTLINTENIAHSNYKFISDNELININGVSFGFLHNGCSFDLNKWKII